MASHKDLIAWKVSMELARNCYTLSDSFPKAERFGLTSQLRKAAISVPANIAEGCGRSTRGELKQFIGIARGSLKELETLLELALMLGFGKNQELHSALQVAERVSRLLWKLRRSL